MTRIEEEKPSEGGSLRSQEGASGNKSGWWQRLLACIAKEMRVLKMKREKILQVAMSCWKDTYLPYFPGTERLEVWEKNTS